VSISIHLDELMIIGLMLFPIGIALFYLLLCIFSFMEIGALAIAGPAAIAVWIAAVILFILGTGMEIH